jgi:hypothetical protein
MDNPSRRDGFLAKTGLVLGCLVAVAVLALALVGWLRRPSVPVAPVPSASAHHSGSGWETRYQAVTALARRGSDLVAQRLSVLAEMLDEDQQLRNYRVILKDGRDAPNEAEVIERLIYRLRAVAELHQKRPDIDLSSLHPAIRKLAESPNAALNTAARRTLVDLGIAA